MHHFILHSAVSSKIWFSFNVTDQMIARCDVPGMETMQYFDYEEILNESFSPLISSGIWTREACGLFRPCFTLATFQVLSCQAAELEHVEILLSNRQNLKQRRAILCPSLTPSRIHLHVVKDRISICTKVVILNDKSFLHMIQQKLAMLVVERKAITTEITFPCKAMPPPQLPTHPPNN